MGSRYNITTTDPRLLGGVETTDFAPLDQDIDLIVNVTSEYPFEYANVMFGYFMPVILVMTLITNTLVVAVLCQRHMRSPTNIVLVTMAIVDMATLLFPAPWYFYIYTLGHHNEFLDSPTVCYFHHIMTDVIPVYFHTSSIWLTLFLAFQRYIYVCHPTHAATWCTVPRVKKVIVSITFVAFLHQLTRFIDYNFVSVRIKSGNGFQTACRMDVAQWVQYVDGEIYYTLYFLFRIVFVFTVPCIALILLNSLLFLALKRAKERREKLLESRFMPIGRDQCSGVTGTEINQYHRSSYIEAGPLNGSTVLNGRHSHGKKSARRANSKRARRTRGFASRFVDKTRRFSTIFSDRGDGSDCKNQTASKAIQFSSPNDQTSDTKVSCTLLDDQLINNEENYGQKALMRSSESVKDNQLENGHQACKANDLELTQLSLCSSRQTAQEDKKDEYIQVGCIKKGLDIDQQEDEDEDNDDDEYICPECAAANGATPCMDEDSEHCRNCSALNDSSRTCHHHHAISQCSSILGGATNTTTNDDISSCAITQNASSSIYVTHDGTFDAIENGSLREEEAASGNDDDQDTNLLRGTRRAKLQRNLLARSIDIDESGAKHKTQGVKIRRQLTCGCGSPMIQQTFFSPKATNELQRNNCRDCCECIRCSTRSNIGHQSDLLNAQSTTRRRDTPSDCVASCSNSDAHVNCYDDRNNNKTGSCSKVGEQTSYTPGNIEHMNHHVHSSAAQSGGKILIPNNEALRISLDADGDRVHYSKGSAISAATTTTTTAATYSTYAPNLLQHTHSRSVLFDGRLSSQSVCEKEPATRQHKSPSLADSTGRGSRATIVGAPNAVSAQAACAGFTGNTAQIRAIESNRTTLMLMVVVTVFLAVEVPVAVTTVIHVFLNIYDARRALEFAKTMSYIKLFTNFSIMMSYSINFTIYCSMSKKFRDTFRDLFAWTWRIKTLGQGRRQANRSSQQHSQIQGQNNQQSQSQQQKPRFCNGLSTNQIVSNNNAIAATLEDGGAMHSGGGAVNNSNNNSNVRRSPSATRIANNENHHHHQECEL